MHILRTAAGALSACAVLLGCAPEGPETRSESAALRRRADTHNTIADGQSHICAVRADGTVRCWGNNGDGALGNGSTLSSASPVVVSGLSNITAIAAGSGWTAAVRSDGTVWRWGFRIGAAVAGNDLSPVQVPGIDKAVAIGGSDFRACVVRTDGQVWCWGSGPLGDGSPSGAKTTTPVQVAISGAVAVSGGQDHHCALLSSGGVRCWGFNDSGQLGDGTFNQALSPVAVSGLTGAVSVAAGADVSCAALADGTARCWGSNAGGLLGMGADLPSNSPTLVTVVGLASATAVTAGWSQFACALLADGTERCWGRNDSGQLGNGAGGLGLHSNTPVVVSGLSGATELGGGTANCAARTDGTLRCWGSNGSGQVGDGTNIERHSPVAVLNLSAVLAAPKVATGSHHTCGLRSNGTVKCWGNNDSGQLGDGTTLERTTPVLLPGVTGVRDLSAGFEHSCVVLGSGRVQCFGSNQYGQLGDNGASGFQSTVPVTVVGLTDAVAVAAGSRSTCAVRASGGVVCWGDNVYGQLGDGSNLSSPVPVAVSGLSQVALVEMFAAHACALLAGGTVRCWGLNFYGELGNGASGPGADSNLPVTVTTGIFPLVGAVGLSTGNSTSCALLAGGTVRCWGAGFDGALGNGSWDDQPFPTAVSGLSDAFDLASGSSSTCFLRATGGARCTGTNSEGELGSSSGMTNSPVTVGSFPFFLGNAVTLDSGFDHSCVMRGDGSISCWGMNNRGQLGDGTHTDRFAPVAVLSFP